MDLKSLIRDNIGTIGGIVGILVVVFEVVAWFGGLEQRVIINDERLDKIEEFFVIERPEE